MQCEQGLVVATLGYSWPVQYFVACSLGLRGHSLCCGCQHNSKLAAGMTFHLQEVKHPCSRVLVGFTCSAQQRAVRCCGREGRQQIPSVPLTSSWARFQLPCAANISTAAGALPLLASSSASLLATKCWVCCSSISCSSWALLPASWRARSNKPPSQRVWMAPVVSTSTQFIAWMLFLQSERHQQKLGPPIPGAVQGQLTKVPAPQPCQWYHSRCAVNGV